MNSKNSPWLVCLVFAALALTVSGCQTVQPPPVQSDAIYQVSLLNGLMQGDYDGTVSVGTLLANGDTGLGTFDRLDGEMIVLDGVVYRARVDGTVEVVDAAETVPFAVVAHFDQDISADALPALADVDALKGALDAMIEAQTGDFNQFYVAAVPGSFARVHVRSVPVQSKPYLPLAEVLKDQAEFEYSGIAGTIVGLRFPEHMADLNVPGWHFHFISEDRTKGGHLLDASLTEGRASLDHIREFQLVQPATETFADLELSGD